MLHGATWEITNGQNPWLSDASVLRDMMQALLKEDYWNAYLRAEMRCLKYPQHTVTVSTL